MEVSGDGSSQTRRHGGRSGAVTPKSFLCPEFCYAQKHLFQTYDKNKNPSPIKICFAPKLQNLTTGLVLPKLYRKLKYFVLKSIRPRDVALNNFFL